MSLYEILFYAVVWILGFFIGIAVHRWAYAKFDVVHTSGKFFSTVCMGTNMLIFASSGIWVVTETLVSFTVLGYLTGVYVPQIFRRPKVSFSLGVVLRPLPQLKAGSADWVLGLMQTYPSLQKISFMAIKNPLDDSKGWSFIGMTKYYPYWLSDLRELPGFSFVSTPKYTWDVQSQKFVYVFTGYMRSYVTFWFDNRCLKDLPVKVKITGREDNTQVFVSRKKSV